VEHLGATPVFVDIEPDTLNVDPERVAEAITERTGAIVPVHFAGLTCDMSALLELAQRHGLALVEDAAHATGARYAGRMVGSIGAATAFSFYANKNLTTAEGGMLTTNDNRLAKLARVYRSHGLSTDAWGRFGEGHVSSPEVVLPGYSFAMPDLAAALGLPQLRKQEHFLTMRERYAHLYDEAFEDLPVRTQPRPRDLELNRHALHIYVLTLEPGTLRVSRDRLVEALRAENIGAGVHYLPLHEHPFYKEKHGYKPSDFPVAHAVGEHILSLPLTAGMSAQDAEDVALAVRKVLAAYAN
jgi:dTDP-4-amino-4,6-dideoxygalactose transaminase